MSSVTSTITLSELTFPDCRQKTIAAWMIVSFTAGSYISGGLPFGLVQFADARTIDTNGFLRCQVFGEDVVTSTVGGVGFHYSPVTDTLQLTVGGVELANGAAIPVTVLNDTILAEATWNRTTVLG